MLLDDGNRIIIPQGNLKIFANFDQKIGDPWDQFKSDEKILMGRGGG